MLNVKPEPFGIYVGPFFSHQIFADLSCFFFLRLDRRQELGHELQEELQRFPEYWVRTTQGGWSLLWV
jgi:hypothetical protein